MLNLSDLIKLYSEEYGVSLEIATIECAKHWRLVGKVLFGMKEDLTVHKIGTFKKQVMAPKKYRHPVTKELMTRPSKVVIKFKQSDFPYT